MISARPIAFSRAKYGTLLSVDAGDVRSLSGFIQSDEPHVNDFYEMVFVEGGRGELDIDGGGAGVARGVTFITRPGQVRRWRMRTPLEAGVILFQREFVDGFFADPAMLDHLLGDAQSVQLAGEVHAQCRDMLVRLAREIDHLCTDSEHVLRAGLYQLLAWVHRAAQPAACPAPGLARRFVELVEREFRVHRRVLEYARMLGVSAEHLSRVIHRELSRSASAVIQERVLLEAKRMLRYSDASIAEIADALAYTDPSHFVRCFKRAVGATPRRFRMSHFGS